MRGSERLGLVTEKVTINSPPGFGEERGENG